MLLLHSQILLNLLLALLFVLLALLLFLSDLLNLYPVQTPPNSLVILTILILVVILGSWWLFSDLIVVLDLLWTRATSGSLRTSSAILILRRLALLSRLVYILLLVSSTIRSRLRTNRAVDLTLGIYLLLLMTCAWLCKIIIIILLCSTCNLVCLSILILILGLLLLPGLILLLEEELLVQKLIVVHQTLFVLLLFLFHVFVNIYDILLQDLLILSRLLQSGLKFGFADIGKVCLGLILQTLTNLITELNILLQLIILILQLRLHLLLILLVSFLKNFSLLLHLLQNLEIIIGVVCCKYLIFFIRTALIIIISLSYLLLRRAHLHRCRTSAHLYYLLRSSSCRLLLSHLLQVLLLRLWVLKDLN